MKKGDLNDASNYRSISLTSVSSKVMEHLLHSQIMNHLEAHGILTDQQHGFRKKRSCESQLILTVQYLAVKLRDGEKIDAVLLDVSRAFNKEPHNFLASNLYHYEIRGYLFG